MYMTKNTKRTKVFDNETKKIFDKEIVSYVEKYITWSIDAKEEKSEEAFAERMFMIFSYFLQDLKEKWIKDIADWLEINKGTNGQNLQSFLHFFEESMQLFLVEDKKEWKEIVKYYREHGELPIPNEIKKKK